MKELPDSLQSLRVAITNHDLATARQVTPLLVHLLASKDVAESHAELPRLMRGIVENRWFDLAGELGEAIIANGRGDPPTERLVTQCLIELGQFRPAEQRLLALAVRPDLSGWDRSELSGHLGRLHKQQFVESMRRGELNRHSLQSALDSYLQGYELTGETSTWHAINAVALMAVADRLKIPIDRPGPYEPLARRVLADVQERTERGLATTYDFASAAEACVALQDLPAAGQWLSRYTPVASPFQLGSTLRQLEEIWDLSRSDTPGPEYLHRLRAELIVRSDSSFALPTADLQKTISSARGASLEVVFGADRFDTLLTYRNALERSRCIARLGTEPSVGVGTGFLINGDRLSPTLGCRPLLVTNRHVLSADEADRARGALHPDEAVVTFEGRDDLDEEPLGVKRIIWSSPIEELDCTVAYLTRDLDGCNFLMAKHPPARGSETMLRVVGHPSGGRMGFSTNSFLDHETPRIHYRSATEGGSSGSPVFTADWRLVAVHHAGGFAIPRLNGQNGTYEANEGILIGPIASAIIS